MTRILPAQIKAWTGGQLIQSSENQSDSERYYRGISTDTRKLRRGEIFLALRGEHFDGHDYAAEAIGKGAALLVLEERSEEAMEHYHRLSRGENLPDLLLVPDTLRAYQDIASGFRQTLLASVIAITGSVGKTTCRRMLSTLISSQLQVHETRENENNLIGVPLTLLEATDADEVLIIELGMDRRGEIKRLSEIVQPDISILTNIGYSHAQYLGSRENILREKTDILSGMKSNGLVIVNGDDPYLHGWSEDKREISIWAVYDDEKRAQSSQLPCFWAENIRLSSKETHFTLRSTLAPEIEHEVCIQVPGKHLVRSALFAFAAAYALGLEMDLAAQACQRFHNQGGRQQFVEIDGIEVMDDSYNAAPESIQAALDTLELLDSPSRRRLVCLGGVRELGQYERSYHMSLGEKLAGQAFDIIYLVGEEMKVAFDTLKAKNPECRADWFPSSSDLIPELLSELRDGDILLLKGSRYYEMESIRKAVENRRKQGD